MGVGGWKMDWVRKRWMMGEGRKRKDYMSSVTAGLWRGKHEGRGRENKKLEDQELRKLEGEQVEGFRFGDFTWKIFGLAPIFFSIGLLLVGEEALD
jgi:hypothetical protein